MDTPLGVIHLTSKTVAPGSLGETGTDPYLIEDVGKGLGKPAKQDLVNPLGTLMHPYGGGHTDSLRLHGRGEADEYDGTVATRVG